MEVNDAKETSERKYEDMDSDSQSIIVFGSGLQRPVSEEPPPLPPRKYEDVDSHGASIIVLCSGLQRATPNVPPPRHVDMGGKEKEQMDEGKEESKRKYEEQDDESIFVSRSELQRSALNEPKSNHCTKKQVHDFRLSAKKQSKEDADDRNVKPPLPPRKLQPTAPNKPTLVPCRVDMGDPVEKAQESVLYQKYEGVNLKPGRVSVKLGSGLKRTVLNEPPPLPARKYEDTDPHGDRVLVLSSETRPKHLYSGDKEKEEVDGTYKMLGSGLQRPVSEEPPPLPPRKYEDVDSHGASIIVLCSGLQRATPNVPPPRHLDMGDKEKEEVEGRNEESDRKYEDVDSAGESIFVLSQGLRRPVPNKLPARRPENKQESSTDKESDRKYEDVDSAGESIFVLSQGLRRPVPYELPARRPENKQESSTDEDRDAPGFCHKVRDRAMELWRKWKSSSLFWPVLVAGVLVTALVISIAIMAPSFIAVGKNQEGVIGAYPMKPGFPRTSVPDKESSFPASYSTSAVSSSKDIPTTPMALPSTTDINECADKPCQHGTCVNKDGGYKCICSVGWTGQNCQQAINECTRKSCQHGTCVNKAGGYKCTCSHGWTGQNCQQAIIECTRKSCQHGTCMNKDGRYICTCSPGWIGKNCQQVINACTDKPCQHGTCVNKDGGYKCTCSSGWTGQNCQQDINECIRNPCQHGRCLNKDGGYKCTCSFGWTGQNCQQDIDECNRRPCEYGTCVNKDGGYKCICLPGWTGQNCQMRSGQDWRQDDTAGHCQRGWAEYNNHCYMVGREPVTWFTADSRCGRAGAHVASILDSEENDFIADIIQNAKGYLRYHVWSGLRRGEDGQFQWTDGSPLSYTNWAECEPDNNGLLTFGKGEKCVSVISKEPPPLPPRKYEDVTLQGDGGVVLSSGLQRATPNLPPPRHLDMGDKEKEQMDGGNEESKRKYEDPDNESIFVSRSELQRSALNEPKSNHCTKKQVHDVRLSANKQSKEDADGRNVKPPLPPRKLQPTAPNKPTLVPCRVDMGDPVEKAQESVLYQKYEGVDLKSGRVSVKLGSGLKRTVLNEPPPLPARKYEDTDPHGDTVLVLSSETRPKHLYSENKEKEEVDGTYKVLGSGLQRPVSGEPPPLPPRNYEDVDSHGASIIVLCSGLQRAAPIVPPPRHLDMGDKGKKEVDGRNEESDRKYEDVDSAGESIFVLSQGLRRPPPYELPSRRPENKQESSTDKESDRKYEDVDSTGESIFVLSQGLRRPVPYELPARRPENKQESSTDPTPDTPEDTNGDEEQDAPGFCHKVRDIDECARNPCQHGTCVNKDVGYNCTCSPGWTGQNCQQDMNECITKPCQHGRCVNKDGGYKCTCSPGWTGQNCQRDINECYSRPCRRGGTCVNNDGGYSDYVLCQNGWWKFKNHCYMLMKKKTSWDQANSACERLGSNLTSIIDSEENSFIADIIRNVRGLLQYQVWFGLKRGKDGQFQWTDGSPLSYTNWAPTEPDNRNNFLSFGQGQGCATVVSKEKDIMKTKN
ncbi:hypothetical protein Bbelb_221090 [Branchiostoma belcheri]|nr:hypothetical protein Bbelb_221090 [Branchiostoma belcheri]